MLNQQTLGKLLSFWMVILITAMALPLATATAQPPTLLGNWKFDDGSGTVATDNSGFGNDGTVVGADWTTGKVNGALSFNGVSDHVVVPASSSLSFPNQVTIALWMYATDLTDGWVTLVHRNNSSFTWFDWQLYAKAVDAQVTNRPVFRVNWNGDNQIQADEEVMGDIVLSPNTWYFIACTYDGSQMKFYIDGTLRGTTDKAGGIIPDGGRDIWIGANEKWNEPFTGTLDEVYIYGTALSQTDIQGLMSGGPPQYSLTVNIIGNGSVTRNPDKTLYDENEVVQLTAIADPGWVFSGWSGDLSGAINPANLTLNTNKTVTAIFTQPSAAGFLEDFNSFTVGQTVGADADWYDGGGGPVVNASDGLIASQGLNPANNIFTWTAHEFNWNDPDFQAVVFQMDFETDGSGNFDDDRMGWMISNSSTSSSDIFGVQLDHSDGGIVTYWRNSSDTRIQDPIVGLSGTIANTWYRFWAKITKLDAASAKIEVSLTQLDAEGNPTGTPYTGTLENTGTFAGGLPDTRYFTATSMWPAYKNFSAIQGSADNAYYELITGAPPVEKFAFAVMSDLHTNQNQSTVQSNLQQVKYLVDNATSDMPAPSFLVVDGDFPNLSQTEASIDLVLGSAFLWYPVIGNHEISDDINNFYAIRDSKVPSLPYIVNYGPTGSVNTSYSWNFGNSHFVAVNEYWDGTTDVNGDHSADGNVVEPLRTWIQNDIVAASQNHTFTFVHEPAYPDHRHVGDALDAHPAERDAFVSMLDDNNVAALFAGHTHYYEHDVSTEYPLLGNVHQITTARGGDYPTSNGPNIVYVVVDGNTITYRAYQSSSSLPFPLIEEWTVTNGVPDQYSLTVNTVGSGSVTKLPDQTLYNPGAVVQLTAVPNTGYIFAGWSGAVVGTENPINVTMTGNLNVTATFVEESPAPGEIETFETGFVLGQDVGNNINWFDGSDDNGSNVEAGIGVAGSIGLAPGQWIATWLAHPFTWQDPLLTGVIIGMDFQTDGSGNFDDDRVGWMIVNNDNSSDNIFGVQLDPGGTGNNIECYWDGDTFGDNGGRTSIVSLPALPANSWYRLRATITKLTNTSAKIDVTLHEIDEYGTVGNLVVSGTIENTSLLPNTSENEIPNNAYFNAATMWPAYKNYQAISGAADNAFFQILTTGTVQHSLTVNITGNGAVAKNPDKTLYDHNEVVELTAVPETGWEFSGWSGDLTGSTNPANLTMDANKTVTAVFTEIGAAVKKVAYNDLNPVDGDANAAFVTKHTYASTNAALIDSATGATLPWTITGTTVGGYDPDHPSNGGQANAGTEAGDLFGPAGSVIVDLGNTIELDFADWDNIVTFNNLDPSKVYNITLSANRNNTLYTNQRFARVTIEGADAFTNASSAGVIVYSEASVSFSIGYNTVNGYVAKWININPGADGSFSIKSEWDNSQAGDKGYAMTAFRLEEISTGPVEQYTLTTEVTGNGSITRNPDLAQYNENSVVELTAVPDDGWIFSGWNGDLTGTTNPQNITMDAEKTVGATFVKIPALAPGDVIIAGFQSWNSVTGQNPAEFVELFNTTDHPISLENFNLISRVDGTNDGTVNTDWQLSDASPSLTGKVIQPHSFFLIAESGVAAFNGVHDLEVDMDLATGEGGVSERAISLELVINDVHMDYVLYGRNDGTDLPLDIPPGDVAFDGSSFPREEVIRNTRGTSSFQEGVIQRLTTEALYAGYDALGYYTDDPAPNTGIWTCPHSDSYGSYVTRNSQSPQVMPPSVTYSLNITIAGNGSVTKNPDKADYNPDEVVELTAAADAGWEFTGWSGDLSGTDNPVNLTMDGNKNVTATFSEIISNIWSRSITIYDASKSQILNFGKDPAGTNGLDITLGEAELPPLPPDGNFDARFVFPTVPAIGSLADYRSEAETYIEWKIKFQPGSGGYPVTFEWDNTILPAGNFYLKDEINGAIVNVDMKTVNQYELSNTAINSLKIVYYTVPPTEQCVNIMVNEGWNIVSVPYLASYMTVAGLFPSAVSSAFGFDNGYTTETTLINGKGYWLKFNAAEEINICGTVVSENNSVNAGWNLIGPFDQNIPVFTITTNPSGILATDFYGFDDGYFAASVLEAGKGYWVKANQSGTLDYTYVPPKTVPGSVQLADINSDWGKIKVSDSKGRVKILYAGSVTSNSSVYELPPVPPEGIFDVRYSNNRFVDNLSEDVRLVLNSVSYPVKINVEGMQIRVRDDVDGKQINKILSAGEDLILSNAAIKSLKIEKLDAPVDYTLYQNYPNPFNPTTTIQFSIPDGGKVSLSLYNVLGERIMDILNSDLSAGYHQVELNATGLPSGVYFYRLEAGSFIALKKLVIMK